MRSFCAALILTVAGLALAAPVLAQDEGFKPKVTDVTVFKNGYALALTRTEAEFDDGWCKTRETPSPVLGAFWAFVADDKAKVDYVKAEMVEVEEERPCLALNEIIQANRGEKAVVIEQVGETEPVEHKGVLLGFLEHETKAEVETARTEPASYDRWGNYINQRQVRDAEERESLAQSSFLMIQTNAGVQLVKGANIRSVLLDNKKPVTTRTAKKKVRQISLHAAAGDKPLSGKADVGIVYLQKGIRWIPNYKVELLEDGKARLSLQGTVINEMVDLENANLRLVVGVPSFVMQDTLSPLALRDTSLRLSSYFQPPAQGGSGATQGQFLSNAIMSQAAMPSQSRGGGGEGGPDIPSEGQQEDLFVYQQSGFTLEKGGRAVVQLFEAIVPYEDIYTWEIPSLPPRELWRNVNQQQQQQLARALSGAKAMHELRLTNKSKFPWTTGPAAIFKEGTPLAQQLLTYTSIGNDVDLPVTIATDLNTTKEERETGREQNVKIYGDSYTKVQLHGTLSVKNFKDRKVKISIERRALGTATEATAGGTIKLANAAEDNDLATEYPWRWWSWPWWWYGVNSISVVEWEAEIEPGKTADFEYDWYYYFRH